jgi:hypothetical protein
MDLLNSEFSYEKEAQMVKSLIYTTGKNCSSDLLSFTKIWSGLQEKVFFYH